jgi:hypothetical protein
VIWRLRQIDAHGVDKNHLLLAGELKTLDSISSMLTDTCGVIVQIIRLIPPERHHDRLSAWQRANLLGRGVPYLVPCPASAGLFFAGPARMRRHTRARGRPTAPALTDHSAELLI